MAPNFTPTTDANAIPTVVAQEMLRVFPGYLNLAKFVSKDTDWTGTDFARYGDTLNITKPGALEVKTKLPNTEMVDQAPNLDKVSVTLNRHKYISILDEDITKMLRKPDTQQRYAEKMAIALAQEVEQFLFGLHADIDNTVTWDNTSATTIEESFLAIRSHFARKLVPLEERKGFFADTSIVDKLLTVPKYTSGDYQANKDAVEKGVIRRQYGIETFESQFVQNSGSPVTRHNIATTREGMVLVNRPMVLDGNGKGVMQTNLQDPNSGLTIRLSESYSHGGLGSRYSLDFLYGGAICDQDQILEVESV